MTPLNSLWRSGTGTLSWYLSEPTRNVQIFSIFTRTEAKGRTRDTPPRGCDHTSENASDNLFEHQDFLLGRYSM